APQAAALCGAYVAYLAHSAIDWDWELPVVTVAALLCAAALLNAQWPFARRSPPAVGARATAAALVGTAVLAACTAVGLAGSTSLHAATESLKAGSWSQAARAARDAARWQPWSAEPYDLLGQAEVASGHPQAAANAFRLALRRDQLRWETWYELGRI